MPTGPNDGTQKLPFLTADTPGIGGVIKKRDDDFIVEEILRYSACGEGTHAYFLIEKRGLSTLDAVRRISRALGRKPRDIGYAGMKDAHGVTRQTLSVEHVAIERIQSLDLPNVRILDARRHTNKLKIGHLIGNEFLIRVRECVPDAVERATPVIEKLVERGMPNYFGPQRFGRRGNNADVGLAAFRGDYAEALRQVLGAPDPGDDPDERRARELFESGNYQACSDAWPRGFGAEARLARHVARTSGESERAWRGIDQKLRMLYVSALQGELFNRVVAQRIESLDRLMNGDLAWKHRNGACFAVEDAAAEQPRCTALEISPTGPVFGARMTPPSGEPGALEDCVLKEAGVDFNQRRTPDGIRIDGARRPLRVPLVPAPRLSAGLDDAGSYVQMQFFLPSGSYASSLLREVCKSDCGR